MKYCSECGRKVAREANFCRWCGYTLHNSHENTIDTFGFFDISSSVNLIRAVVLTALITMSLLEIYIYLDDNNPEFNLHVLLLFGFVFSVLLAYKGFSGKSLVISCLGVLIAFLFGGIFALPFIVFILTIQPSQKIESMTSIKRSLITNYSKVGIIYMTIGAVVTVGSLLLAEEGGTYYVLYGASLVGGYYLLRGAFHSIFPSSLNQKEQQVLSEVMNQSSVHSE